jgi:UDP-glucose 4-epimerase
LVTGGAGFIGSHLVDRLIGEGSDVVVLDDFSHGRRENLNLHLGKPNLCLIGGNVLNSADVRKALTGVNVVFHLAAITSVDFSVKNPILVDNVNVGGTLNVLKQSLKTGVERFVYASSCAVYGEPIRLPINEEYPTKPLSPYAVSKLSAEHYCRVFYKIYGLETVCLRFFNVYGPRQRTGPYSGVITSFIDKLRICKPPTIHGDGEQTRDFVYVKDVAEACLRAASSKNCVGQAINIGSGIEAPINEVAKTLTRLMKVQEIRFAHAKPRAGDIRRSCADISKARKLLGYEPKIPFVKGLKMLLDEYGDEQ